MGDTETRAQGGTEKLGIGETEMQNWQSGNWAIPPRAGQSGVPGCPVAELSNRHLCNGGAHLPQERNEVSRCLE